ncbi:MAG: hypothetical protein IAE79_27030 [Anaerolinea sp.]|nr:hypothetical protein [Anaerolinea sp.]
MNDLKSTTSDELHTHLTHLLETNRPELVNRYQQVLRETLFSRRTTIRPAMLRSIAADEVDALGSFLRQPHLPTLERGAQLYQTGLSEQPVLRMGQATRQFFVTRIENGQIAAALEVIDAYQEGIILGFIQSLEKAVADKQERTRQAFERVVSRDKS